MAGRQIAGLFACALALMAGLGTERAQAQNWDGSGLVKFGVFLQGSLLDYDIQKVSPAGLASDFSAKPNGVGVGVSAGYDLRLGSFLLGAELDVSFDDASANSKPRTAEQYGVDFYSTVRGRLGVFLHPSFMVYGTAGYGLVGAEYKLNGFPAVATINGPGNKKTATIGGLVYGAGAEYDMGWGIGFFEYLHSDFSSWSFSGFDGSRISLDGQQDVFRLGLKFKIGHDFSHDVYRVPDSMK